jgi:anti-sigma B factor antagonist/stage II sporulation protein AA (anti-sigma F factor antagonist)
MEKMDDLEIFQEKKGNISILRLKGIMDSSTCMQFGIQFKEIAERPGLLLILDLKELSYINSIGIGTMVSNIRKIQSSEGRVCFFQVSEEVKHVFDLTGLSNIFFFFDDEDSALKFLTGN